MNLILMKILMFILFQQNEENNDVIINASPIEYGHSLLVPNRLHGKLPQVLTERSVVLAIR